MLEEEITNVNKQEELVVFQSKLSLVYKESYSSSEEEGSDDYTGGSGELGSATPGNLGVNTIGKVLVDPESGSVADLVVDVSALFLEGDGQLLLVF